MRLSINLATRTYVSRKKLDLLLGGVATVLVLVLLFLGKTAFFAMTESWRLEKEIRAYDERFKAASGVSEQDYNRLMAEIAFANNLIDKKTMNWAALLDRLETVVPDGVAINAIEPDLRTGGLKLSGLTRKFASLRGFMEHLEADAFYREVYLQSLSDTKVGETQSGLAFTISCKVDYRAL